MLNPFTNNYERYHNGRSTIIIIHVVDIGWRERGRGRGKWGGWRGERERGRGTSCQSNTICSAVLQCCAEQTFPDYKPEVIMESGVKWTKDFQVSLKVCILEIWLLFNLFWELAWREKQYFIVNWSLNYFSNM